MIFEGLTHHLLAKTSEPFSTLPTSQGLPSPPVLSTYGSQDPQLPLGMVWWWGEIPVLDWVSRGAFPGRLICPSTWWEYPGLSHFASEEMKAWGGRSLPWVTWLSSGRAELWAQLNLQAHILFFFDLVREVTLTQLPSPVSFQLRSAWVCAGHWVVLEWRAVAHMWYDSVDSLLSPPSQPQLQEVR